MSSSSAASSRGALIVIEGLDRAGKTTQADRLLARLRAGGTDVVLQKFPDRTTPTGKMIDAYLRSESDLDDRAIHLLFSANRWEIASKLRALLAQGTTVLCDRYAFSGVAFSAAKGLPRAWCAAPDAGLPRPDLTLFLDVAPDAARARGGYGEERYETADVQARVRVEFAALAGQPERERGPWRSLDAGRALEEVESEIWGAVAPLAGGVHGEVGRLWDV